MTKYVVLNQFFMNEDESECGDSTFNKKSEAIKNANQIYKKNKNKYLSIQIKVLKLNDQLTEIKEYESLDEYIDDYFFELIYKNENKTILNLESDN